MLSGCVAGGIKPVMITGDHVLTAKAIAKGLGFLNGDEAITGDVLQRMSNEELSDNIYGIMYLHGIPEHKVRIKGFSKPW